MAQVDSENSIAVPAASTRRRFLSQAASVAAGGAALIGASTVAGPVFASTGAPDDAALLQLKEQIFEAWHAANAHNDEINRLDEVRKAEYERLLEQETAQGQYISSVERWELVYSTPEVLRLDRLVIMSEHHFIRMADLIDRMWDIPAKTEAGRSAKVGVLLSCVMNWRDPDENLDWQPLMARRLLIDLVGGEEAESFREIYA